MQLPKSIFKVVLTGGPCGGKSTSLSFLNERLTSLGYATFIVPETATNLILGGARPWEMTSSQLMIFQEGIIRNQMQMEQFYVTYAKTLDKPSVIILDRGRMDGKAFSSPDQWQAILDMNQWSESFLRDSCYDGVIHLVTAANGAEEFYTCENNKARSETPQQAREADAKIQSAWLGHPKLRVVGNDTDFKTKVTRVAEHVCDIIGAPKPIERERKFVIKNWNGIIPVPYVTIEIDQTYLANVDDLDIGEERIRRRGQNNSHVYFHTIKKNIAGSPSERLEVEKIITAKEYVQYYDRKDPDYGSIQKSRHCFLYKNSYFELDVYQEPKLPFTILEVESPEDNIEFPDFLEIEKEVTEDPDYKNSSIARHAITKQYRWVPANAME